MPDSEPAATALTVRRAVLPWRRVIRPSRLDFTPGGGFGALVEDPLGWLVAIVLLPLWLPAAVVCLPALVELVLELLVLPVVLLRRRSRREWPVQVLDGSRVVRAETFETFAVAGRRAESLRSWLFVHRGDDSSSRWPGEGTEPVDVQLPPRL